MKKHGGKEAKLEKQKYAKVSFEWAWKGNKTELWFSGPTSERIDEIVRVKVKNSLQDLRQRNDVG